MNPAESLKHTKWECKYHVVWIPKYRKKSLYQGLRSYLVELLKDLAAQKECKILGAFWRFYPVLPARRYSLRA